MQKSILIEETQLEPIDDSKASYYDMKWKQWEAEMLKTHPPKTLDVIESLPSILTDPVDGNDMVKEGGMWKNQVSGSVFLCKNVLFELVENTLEPVFSSLTEPVKKSPVSGKPMLKYSSKRIFGLVIDKCAESGGFYFDAGELIKLKSFELKNLIKNDEEYQEYRDGYTVSRSKHRWTGHGVFGGAPGVGNSSVFIKFRTAVFFNKPIGVGFKVSSLTWLQWLLSLPFFSKGGFSTSDPVFDGSFGVESENNELAKFILDEEVRKEMLELSKISNYGDLGEIEVARDYIAYVEGPYTSLNTGGTTPIGTQSQDYHFDKTEEVLARLVSLAKKIEDRVSKFS